MISYKKEQNTTTLKFSWVWLILGVLTSMVGYTIHNSIFWAIMDVLFWPFAWIKWLVLKQVNLSIIKETFEFFLK